jgi:hypothetical protein
MIRRETDAALINRIANHPKVLPLFDLAKTGALDFAECVERPDDYVILSDGALCCAIFEWSAPRVWQGHTLFHPNAATRYAVTTGRAICVRMLSDGADMLWGMTPSILRHVRWFNRQLGFSSAGIGFHHVSGEVEYFTMRKSNGCTPHCGGRDIGG